MKSYDAMQTKILTFNLENHYMLNFTYFCSRYKYINIIFFCCHWLAMSNSCYNPIIYGICSVSKTLSLLVIYLNLFTSKYVIIHHIFRIIISVIKSFQENFRKEFATRVPCLRFIQPKAEYDRQRRYSCIKMNTLHRVDFNDLPQHNKQAMFRHKFRGKYVQGYFYIS